jgi:uncharacterized membrane protein
MRSACVALSLVLTQAAIGQTFAGLGFYAGEHTSQAGAISADGLTVIGDGPGGQPGMGFDSTWRWRPGGALEFIATRAEVSSVSSDGNIVGGAFGLGATFPAFRWTAQGGAVQIAGVFSAGAHAPGVSGNGHVVVGSTQSSGTGDPVRWTPETGPVTIPNPPLGPLVRADVSNAFATNFDGSVVVGGMIAQEQGQPFGVLTSFRWTASGGTEIIRLAGGGLLQAGAIGVSQDGATVIAGNTSVYRWRASTGFVVVPGLSVNAGLSIPALSGDGNTITSIDKIWNVSTGTQPLTTLLASAGCNFSGWTNLIVTGVDFDGNTFCGYGNDPAGLTEAWYATVPAPPSLIVLPGLALLGMRRRA